MIEPNRAREVVVSEVFAEAHQFVPGDTVRSIINGRVQELTIVGVALSPEYIIQIQPGSILPDNKRFGIFWINQRDLESAFDMTGAFNSVSLKLSHGANTREIIARLDQLLKPFGSIGGFDRTQQLSYQYLSDELAQLRAMALLAPAIFLSVAAFLLNIVISRVITQQREQIAALKAFGYTNYEVGFHYLNLVLVISLTGAVVGSLFGFWMAYNMTLMYQEFYRFPLLVFRLDRMAVVWAFLLTSLSAVVGTWLAVRRAIALPPAEAMRPEPPPSYQPTLLERLIPSRFLPMEFRMIIRNVARKPLKAIASVIGIAMAVAVMILGSFTIDAIDYMIDIQFRKVQRQDLTVSFVEPATASVIYELTHLDGVLASETIRSIATRVHFEQRSRRIGIMGLEPDSRLFRLLNEDEQAVQVPAHGIMLNQKLSELLGTGLGDLVTVEVLEGKRPIVTVEVTAIIKEYSGVNAYMDKRQLHTILQESLVASGAFLKVDKNSIDKVFHELESRPGIGSVTIKEAAIQSFTDTIAENMLTMRSFIVMFATVIAIGVVYNTARISLSEQSRDLATLRVVGFTRGEVSTVLLGEVALLTLCAIPLGCAIGYLLAGLMCMGLDTENYRIPLVVSGNTFGSAAVVVAVATILSGLVVQRQITKLDLVGVLKTRE